MKLKAIVIAVRSALYEIGEMSRSRRRMLDFQKRQVLTIAAKARDE